MTSLTNLETYDFSYKLHTGTQTCFTDRKHRTEINNSFGDFIDQLIGGPQGSVLAPFLFKNYICDLFFFIEEENSRVTTINITIGATTIKNSSSIKRLKV